MLSYLLYRWKCSGFNNLVHLFLLVLNSGQQALHIHLPVIVVLLPPLVHFCNLHQNWLPYINRTACKQEVCYPTNHNTRIGVSCTVVPTIHTVASHNSLLGIQIKQDHKMFNYFSSINPVHFCCILTSVMTACNL